MGFNDKFAVLVRFGRLLPRAASGAVEATNGPAVQSLTWARPTVKFLILENRKPIHRWIIKFPGTETRISVDYCAN
jgi:hypothetical protein